MGTIECRPVFGFLPDPDVTWEYAIDLGHLYCGQNYDAFGCLFGVMNFAGFQPVAADRGLPAGAASQTVEAAVDGTHATWVSWAEIEAIDWTEAATRPDERMHWYTRDENGQWRYAGKAGQDTVFAEHLGLSPAEAAARSWPAGSQWVIGERLYRAEILSRRDAIPSHSEWRPVWAVMAALSDAHGPDNVRLVAWFDQ